jgi:NAD(P)-dependent dehydrogenase (short-subunit alcohol dehydrogenase family)
MNRLANKVAVITGGNSGIGFATARVFVAEGAHVLIVGRRLAAVNAAVSELGDRATGLTGDLADPATHDRVASLVEERFGGLDIYVANAGVNTIARSDLVSLEEYDAQLATNTRSVFFGVQIVASQLRNGGAILLTSSIASSKVFEGHAAYAGSKAAIEAFARSWALEFKERGIRVNVISPGPVDTPFFRSWVSPSPIARHSRPPLQRRFRWADWAARKSWRKPRFFSLATKAASLPV